MHAHPDRQEAAMTRNMGTTDRLVRALLVAPAAVVAGLLLGDVAAVALFVVAAVMLATAAAGSCPLYSLLGLSTVRRSGRPGTA
jgi:hypothetical protein